VDDCIFCKIIRGELPSRKVLEDDEVLAIYDMNAVAPTHILVIPCHHFGSLNDTSEKDASLLGKLMQTAIRIAREQKFDPSGYRIVVNTGPDGGQTVGHLHMHLLAGRQMSWPPG
jgi:histidine triad (HIT) family protein